MRHQDLQKTITARIYQSLAQQGVQINALPPDQFHALVEAIADAMTTALDALESEAEEVSPAPAPSTDPTTAEEVLLWKGRPYLSIGIRYELTNQRLRINRGLLSHSVEEIELVRIRDTAIRQHVGERAINVGDITLVSNDPRYPEFVLHNVREPLEVRELIRKAVLAARERYGLYYREEM
jgi:hypothetical protein